MFIIMLQMIKIQVVFYALSINNKKYPILLNDLSFQM